MKSLIVKENNYVISESMDLDYLRIYPKLSIDACKGKTVTMILNGQVERILPGEYEGEIQLIYTYIYCHHTSLRIRCRERIYLSYRYLCEK